MGMAQQSQPENKEPTSKAAGNLAELLDLAVYDEADIDSAVSWWDEHASDGWQGALEE